SWVMKDTLPVWQQARRLAALPASQWASGVVRLQLHNPPKAYKPHQARIVPLPQPHHTSVRQILAGSVGAWYRTSF
ncbi:hypothetical protein NY486_19885, partial [Enterobacter hormaechei]|nr:hypothetical protein [Enterobacter hormaechei]